MADGQCEDGSGEREFDNSQQRSVVCTTAYWSMLKRVRVRGVRRGAAGAE